MRPDTHPLALGFRSVAVRYRGIVIVVCCDRRTLDHRAGSEHNIRFRCSVHDSAAYRHRRTERFRVARHYERTQLPSRFICKQTSDLLQTSTAAAPSRVNQAAGSVLCAVLVGLAAFI